MVLSYQSLSAMKLILKLAWGNDSSGDVFGLIAAGKPGEDYQPSMLPRRERLDIIPQHVLTTLLLAFGDREMPRLRLV